jgi:hypothetical protein
MIDSRDRLKECTRKGERQSERVNFTLSTTFQCDEIGREETGHESGDAMHHIRTLLSPVYTWPTSQEPSAGLDVGR